MKKTFVFITLTLVFVFNSVNSFAQIKVSLKIDESIKSARGEYLFCDKDYNCGLSQNENVKTSGIEKAGVLTKIWRNGKDFYFLIDTNNNKKLTDEKKILLQNNSAITVKLKKTLAPAKIVFLPFEISHQHYEKNGTIEDIFKIVPHYVDNGTLSYKSCSSNLALSDMNFDGKFDMSESTYGTNFHIDRNNDGKFWGQDEHLFSKEILEFCGQNFLISEIADDGSYIIFEKTDLQRAKVGMKSPKFELILLCGKKIKSDEFLGKTVLLDFWASWCLICVEKLPEIKELEKAIPIFYINTDEADKIKIAGNIIEQNNLTENSVVSGLGQSDKMWKTFARINDSLPLYVLLDKEGTIVYAGNGGENLKDLKSLISEMTK